jgi:hypothetical protein
MTWDEATHRRDSGCDPNHATEAGPAHAAADVDVLPMIGKAVAQHRHDLPELMKRYAYKWAAYHGEQRLEIGTSKQELYHKYLDRGVSRDELVVLGIGPEIPDEIDGEELLDF